MSLRLVLLLGALALVNSTPPVHAAQPMKKITVAGVKASFDVQFDVQLSAAKSGSFTLEVHPEWAPLGAARFKSLVKSGFFTDCRYKTACLFAVLAPPSVFMQVFPRHQGIYGPIWNQR